MIKEMPSSTSLNKDDADYIVYCDICKKKLEIIPAEKEHSHYTHIYSINITEKSSSKSAPLTKHEKIFTKDLCPRCSVKYNNKIARKFDKLAVELVNNAEVQIYC